MSPVTVLNPVGFPPQVSRQMPAARLDGLDGKTVYLVDCRFDDSDIFLGQMQAWFAQHLPRVRALVKRISNVYLNDDPTTWEEIKARGVNYLLIYDFDFGADDFDLPIEDEVTQKAGARIDLDLEGLLAVPRSLGYEVTYRRAERPAALSVS